MIWTYLFFFFASSDLTHIFSSHIYRPFLISFFILFTLFFCQVIPLSLSLMLLVTYYLINKFFFFMFLIGKLSPSQKKSTYSFLSISSLFSSSSIFLFTPLSVFFPLHPFFSRSYSFSLSPNGSNCIWPSRTAVANREPYITASPIYIYSYTYIHT